MQWCRDIFIRVFYLITASLRVTMQAYSSTLLQFIFKFQLVYFPYFYDDKVQKKCTNLVHSCNQMVHSYFARYSRNRKISAKNARYLPFFKRYLPLFAQIL